MTSPDRYLKRLRIETRAIWNMVFIQPGNSDVRKFLIFTLVVTWAVITTGIAFEQALVTPTYSMLTALVWALIGRAWGGEVKDITSGAGERG